MQVEKKTITDYVLTKTTIVNTVKQTKIDKEKQYGLKNLEKNTATNENKKIYSDHNSVLIYLDFVTTNGRTKATESNNKKII